MAHTHVFRVIDALLESRAHFSFAWKDVDLLPHGTLPPSALIVAFSPLVDRRAIDALRDISARGFPLVVVDTLPEEQIVADEGAEGELARRVWLLHRSTLRAELRSSGVPVLRWWETDHLDGVLRTLTRVPAKRNRAVG
jgi:uncharacterized protein (DUF58 family)